VSSNVNNPLIPRITALMRILHIYSAMPVLLLMFFFAITGVFLNHPNWDKTQSDKQNITVIAPSWLASAEDWESNFQQHGLRLLQWLDAQHNIRATKFAIEWDDFDRLLILNLDSPAGNTLVEAVVDDSEVIIDQRQLSPLAMLNNVHRAKNTSGLWLYLSDASAVGMILFCLSGFWLVVINRLQRKPAIAWFSGGSALFIFVIYLMH